MKDIKLNDYAIVITQIVSGITPVETKALTGTFYNMALDNTNNRRLLFIAEGANGIVSYTYNTDGSNIVQVDSIDPGTPYIISIAVDPAIMRLFIGNASGQIFSYPYDSNGNIGSQIDDSHVYDDAMEICIDTTNKLLAIARYTLDVATISYDAFGDNLTLEDTNDTGRNTLSCAIDTTEQLLFYGGETPIRMLSSLTYDSGGNLTAVDEVSGSSYGEGVAIDQALKLCFFANRENGLSTYAYDDLGNFTTKDNIDLGGLAFGISLDTEEKFVFLANWDRGLDVFRYDEEGILTPFKNVDNTGNGDDTIFDDVNKIIFMGGASNIDSYIYEYTESSEMALTGNPWDLYFENGDLVIINEAEYLQQKIGIKLKFFYQEWFLDTTKGIDYFGLVFVKNPNLNAIDNMIKVTILEVNEIIELLEYTSSFNNRILNISFKANTIYGEISYQQEFTI